MIRTGHHDPTVGYDVVRRVGSHLRASLGNVSSHGCGIRKKYLYISHVVVHHGRRF